MSLEGERDGWAGWHLLLYSSLHTGQTGLGPGQVGPTGNVVACA